MKESCSNPILLGQEYMLQIRTNNAKWPEKEVQMSISMILRHGSSPECGGYNATAKFHLPTCPFLYQIEYTRLKKKEAVNCAS